MHLAERRDVRVPWSRVCGRGRRVLGGRDALHLVEGRPGHFLGATPAIAPDPPDRVAAFDDTLANKLRRAQFRHLAEVGSVHQANSESPRRP